MDEVNIERIKMYKNQIPVSVYKSSTIVDFNTCLSVIH